MRVPHSAACFRKDEMHLRWRALNTHPGAREAHRFAKSGKLMQSVNFGESSKEAQIAAYTQHSVKFGVIAQLRAKFRPTADEPADANNSVSREQLVMPNEFESRANA